MLESSLTPDNTDNNSIEEEEEIMASPSASATSTTDITIKNTNESSSSKKRRKQSNPVRYGNDKGSSVASDTNVKKFKGEPIEEGVSSGDDSSGQGDSVDEDIPHSRVRRRLDLSCHIRKEESDSEEEREEGEVASGVYLCPFCSASFTSDEECKGHIQQEHVIKLLENQLLHYQFGRNQVASGGHLSQQQRQQMNMLQQHSLHNQLSSTGTPGPHVEGVTPESLLDSLQLQSLMLSQQSREREHPHHLLQQTRSHTLNSNRGGSRTSSRSSSTSNPHTDGTGPESPSSKKTFPSTEALRNLASSSSSSSNENPLNMFPFPQGLLGPQGLQSLQGLSPAEASKAMAAAGIFGPHNPLNSMNPMGPFLFPAVFSGNQGNPSTSRQGGLGGSIPTSSGSFCIFNPEAYCEHCNKEFCNKYFLKVHKANKHGIYTGDNPPPNASSRSSVTDANRDQNSNSNGPSNNSSNANTCQQQSNTTNTSNNNNNSSNNGISPESSERRQVTSESNDNSGNDRNNERMNERSNRERTSPFSQLNPVSAAAAAASAFFPAGLLSSEDNSNREKFDMTSRLSSGQHGPHPPINMESYCEICQKEFCNKYFVKKHKQNVHGIKMSGGSASSRQRDSRDHLNNQMDSASSSSPPARESLPRDQMENNLSPNSTALSFIQQQQLSNGQQQQEPMTGLDAAFGGIGLKEYFNKFFSQASSGSNGIPNISNNRSKVPPSSSASSAKQTEARLSMTPSSSSNAMPFDLQSALAFSMSQQSRMNGNGNHHPMNASGSPSESPLHPSLQTNLQTNTTPNSSNSNGNANSNPTNNSKPPPMNPANIPKNYCNICNKELCNKYFMKVHMLKMHQINIDEQPAEAAGASTIGGVTCDICQKELCSKYFLKVHKQNTHGIYEEAPGRAGTGESGRNRSNPNGSSSLSSNLGNNLSSLPIIPVSSSSLSSACQPPLPPAVTLQQHLNSLIPMPVQQQQQQNQMNHHQPQEGMMSSSPPRDKESPQAARGIDPRDTNNRYFSHYTEVCPACERRFKSIKWLKTHIHNDHSDMTSMLRHLPQLHEGDNGSNNNNLRSRSSSYSNLNNSSLSAIPSSPRQNNGQGINSNERMPGIPNIPFPFSLPEAEEDRVRTTPNGNRSTPDERRRTPSTPVSMSLATSLNNTNSVNSHLSEVCPLCEERFPSHSWLKEHITSDHSDLRTLNRLPLFAGMNSNTRYKMMSFVLLCLEAMSNGRNETSRDSLIERSSPNEDSVLQTPDLEDEEADQENQQSNTV